MYKRKPYDAEVGDISVFEKSFYSVKSHLKKENPEKSLGGGAPHLLLPGIRVDRKHQSISKGTGGACPLYTSDAADDSVRLLLIVNR